MSYHPRMHASHSAPDGVRRSFHQDGRRWTVCEVEARHLPPGERRRCLIFECDAVVRRVYGYPVDWVELDATALWALSFGR